MFYPEIILLKKSDLNYYW